MQVQDKNEGMIRMTTLAEAGTNAALTRSPMTDEEAKAAALAIEVEHRREVAKDATRALPRDVRFALDSTSDAIKALIEDGSWKKAAVALDKVGERSLAAWLRLETPYALDC